MEALIPVFVAVLLAEFGGRMQSVAHRAALQTGRDAMVLGALSVSTLANLGFGAIGGAVIAAMIEFDARSLLFGLALLFAGIPMFVRLRATSPKIETPGFARVLFRLARVQFGDASQFIVFAAAARTGQPVLAIAGGVFAVLAAAAVPMALRGEWPGAVPLVAIRRFAAALLTLAGLWASLVALRLI